MIDPQVQIPDGLFQRARKLAAEKEWSFAEVMQRGLWRPSDASDFGTIPTGAWWNPAR